MTGSLDRGRAVLASQPFAALPGTERTACDADAVALEPAMRGDFRRFASIHGTGP